MDAIEWAKRTYANISAYARGRPDLKQQVAELETNLTHEQRRSTDLDQRARDAKTNYDNYLRSSREAAAALEASSREREKELEQRVTNVEGERKVAADACVRERQRNRGLREQVAELIPKAHALKIAEKQAADMRNLVGLFKANFEHYHPNNLLHNAVFEKVTVPLLWLDKYQPRRCRRCCRRRSRAPAVALCASAT